MGSVMQKFRGKGQTQAGQMGNNPGNMGARRDMSEKGQKAIYFKDVNFGEEKKNYAMTKITFGVLGVIVVFAAAVFLLGWSPRLYILATIAFAFWGVYFARSLAVKSKLSSMPYAEARTYWTFEHTPEYTDRNAVLNKFKQSLASSSFIERTTLIDDVAVEMISYDPLIFDFAIRSNRANAKNIIREVGEWYANFDAINGQVERMGTYYRVTYSKKSMWEILDGKKVTPEDASNAGENKPSVAYNPIGVKIGDMREVYLDNCSIHTSIVGQTGYGKSNTFNMILYNLYPTNAIILFFGFKQEEGAAMEPRCWNIYTYEQAVAWISAMEKERERRSDYLSSAGKRKFLPPELAMSDSDAAPFTDEYPPVIVAVDECAMWIADPLNKGAQKMKAFLNEMAKVGRSYGFTLLVGSQDARDTSLPKTVMGSVDQKISFRLTDPATEANAVDGLGSGLPRPTDIPAKKGTSGGGIGQFCFSSGVTDQKPWACKAYYISTPEVTAGALKHAANKRTKSLLPRIALREYKDAQKKNPKQQFPPFSQSRS